MKFLKPLRHLAEHLDMDHASIVPSRLWVPQFAFSTMLQIFLSSAYVVLFLFSTSYHFHYACLRDDIEDEQYLFDGVQLTEAEYRELR